MRNAGGINSEKVEDAYKFAANIAREHQRRVKLRPDGRGLVGQLMWVIDFVDDKTTAS